MSQTEIAELEARHAALQAELAERTRARDELARMLADPGHAPPPRRSMWIMIAIGALGVCVIAIGGLSIYRATRPPPRPTNGVAERFSHFTDQMCACTTDSCVELTAGEMDRWAQLVALEQPPVVIDDATSERLAELGKHYAACVRAFTNR